MSKSSFGPSEKTMVIILYAALIVLGFIPYVRSWCFLLPLIVVIGENKSPRVCTFAVFALILTLARLVCSLVFDRIYWALAPETAMRGIFGVIVVILSIGFTLLLLLGMIYGATGRDVFLPFARRMGDRVCVWKRFRGQIA